jgi:hypothetical protein
MRTTVIGSHLSSRSDLRAGLLGTEDGDTGSYSVDYGVRRT